MPRTVARAVNVKTLQVFVRVTATGLVTEEPMRTQQDFYDAAFVVERTPTGLRVVKDRYANRGGFDSTILPEVARTRARAVADVILGIKKAKDIFLHGPS